MDSLTSAYQAALAANPQHTARIERGYKLALDPRLAILNSSIDVPSISQGFIVIGWVRSNACVRVGACECADYHKHGPHWFCKHRWAVALILRATELEHPEPCEPISHLWTEEHEYDCTPIENAVGSDEFYLAWR